jgi:GT2 family glycosyltransferase
MPDVTLITVTYAEWHTYTKRAIRMVEHFTDPNEIELWIVCDNGSPYKEELEAHEFSLPVVKVYADENVGDLPRYNALMELVTTDYAVVISPDVRIFSNDWLGKLIAPFSDESVAIVGPPGPGAEMTPSHAGSKGGSWHWVPKLLVDRDIPFDTCEHVQTHCFAVRTGAFRDVAGFWTPEGEYTDKGHLMAGEISLSVYLRAAGWKLSNEYPRMHHYGSAAQSEASVDAYDRNAKWEVPF